MRRVLLFVFAVAVLMLAACASGENHRDREAAGDPARDTSNIALTGSTAQDQAILPRSAAQQPTAAPAPTLEPAGEPLAGHALGPEDAYLTIVMYGDFQCQPCARFARDLAELLTRYPDDLRLIWRHLPDTRAYDKTALAVQASEAAAAQGAFWEMHDQLFTHQDEWSSLTPEEFRARLSDYAVTVGLDVARFDAELDAGTYAHVVTDAQREAADLEILGVPYLLYNGVPFTGRDDLYGLDEGVRLALLERRFFDSAPDITIDPEKTYRATIVTEKGDIVIELFPRDAPVTVNNFVFLARSGWYDDITFHYVLPGYLAQTGDPSNTGRGGPGYTIPDEHANGLSFDREGLVAMAHPPGVFNSAGSEFFITLGPLRPAREWDGQYTIFGIVVSGMDIVHTLTPRNANDPIRFPDPPPGDHVITIEIEEF
jgi:cyclophilin family peptidyl-prolyl cis-trans isomerase/protein-disulfide isomerase